MVLLRIGFDSLCPGAFSQNDCLHAARSIAFDLVVAKEADHLEPNSAGHSVCFARFGNGSLNSVVGTIPSRHKPGDFSIP